MNFDEWLAVLDNQLRQSSSKTKITDLNPEALEAAYEADESPVLFAKRPALPLRASSQRPKRVRRPKAWLVLMLALVPLAVTYRMISQNESEKAGWVALVRRQKWPVQLPFSSGLVRGYMPRHASLAVPEVEKWLRNMLLSPASGDFLECEPIAAYAPGRYMVNGKVEAVNQFGTKVVADFSVFASQPMQEGGGRNGEERTFLPTSKEWTIDIVSLGATAQSSIWNSSVGSPTNAKVPPKKVKP